MGSNNKYSEKPASFLTNFSKCPCFWAIRKIYIPLLIWMRLSSLINRTESIAVFFYRTIDRKITGCISGIDFSFGKSDKYDSSSNDLKKLIRIKITFNF